MHVLLLFIRVKQSNNHISSKPRKKNFRQHLANQLISQLIIIVNSKSPTHSFVKIFDFKAYAKFGLIIVKAVELIN